MRIKNWKKFQHFRDRKPPWIKLYRDLLGEQHDSNFAEQVFNSVALTMLTKICLGIAENNGTAAFESYWSDVDSKLREMIQTFACEPTKH